MSTFDIIGQGFLLIIISSVGVLVAALAATALREIIRFWRSGR